MEILNFYSKIMSFRNITHTLYALIWRVILPEFLKNSILYIIIRARYGATKSLRWLCDIDLLGVLSWKISFAESVILWSNIMMSGGNITVGKYTYIGWQSDILSSDENPIQIGAFCSIARNFFAISYSLHDGSRLSTSTSIHGPIQHADHGWPISIGHDVWIGANVTILPGVTIGNGAIIGAWSIVTKDVPPYAIAVWNPAKVIKYRFDDETIAKLQNEKWWEKPIEEIYALHKSFGHKFPNQ